MHKTKEVAVFRIYKDRPAKIKVLVDEELEDYENVELTNENVVSVEFLDEAFKKAYEGRNEVANKIIANVSGEDVKRLPRKAKKQLKKSIGVPNRMNKVRLIRSSLIKTVLGFEMKVRKQNLKNK